LCLNCLHDRVKFSPVAESMLNADTSESPLFTTYRNLLAGAKAMRYGCEASATKGEPAICVHAPVVESIANSDTRPGQGRDYIWRQNLEEIVALFVDDGIFLV
jgi:hypothetical protein